MNRFLTARACVPALAAALAGCAGFSDDGGFTPVQQAAQQRLGAELLWARSDDDRPLIDQKVGELLAQPLDADRAVQIALLNNRGLQADYGELGLAEADVVQAGRLVNPGISFSRDHRGSEVEREFGLHLGLGQLLAMPLTGPIERSRFVQVQRETTLKVLALAHATRRAYYSALAADESVQHLQRANDAADAAAELAQRMVKAGNWSPLQQAREQSLFADTRLNLAQAVQTQASARERLLRLLGLDDPAALKLPDRLPDLPASPQDLPATEQQAMDSRLDLQAWRAQADATANHLGLTQRTRFINVLELGFTRTTSNEAPTQRGYEVRFELPLFDGGGARMAKAEATYQQTLNRAAEAATNARSEVRGAHRAYRSRYDIARQFKDEVLPLRKRMADENLRRYNGMLIGVFELLADARAQIDAVNGATLALRDFWLAQADLEMALVGPVKETP